GNQEFSGKHAPVCAGGKSGWRGKPYQSSGTHDTCFRSEGAARKTGCYRFARQAFSGCGRCPRFNRRFEDCARSDLITHWTTFRGPVTSHHFTSTRSAFVEGAEITRKTTSSSDLFMNLCWTPGATSIPEPAGIWCSLSSVPTTAVPEST